MKTTLNSQNLLNFMLYMCVLTVLSLSSILSVAMEEEDAFEEYEIKAVYLLNFANFVFWPKQIENRFKICILGKDPFGKSLDIAVEAEEIAGQMLLVQRTENIQQINNCKILFISQSFDGSLDDILQPLKPMLTVSDRNDFITQGGMIQFTNSEDDQVRFKVVPHILEQAGLKVSTDLLEIAEIVE